MKSLHRIFLCLLLLIIGTTPVWAADTVVVYTALDQVFSEPILKDFEKKYNIRVKAVYDIEAVKSTGLVNRLIAEKSNPRCDVFWNNEILRTILLKKKGVLAQYVSPSADNIPPQFKDTEDFWTAFAARARVLVANTSLLTEENTPSSIFDLTSSEKSEHRAIANPLFGTTTTHIAALYAFLGAEKAKTYLQNLKESGVKIVDGNSVVRDMAGSGAILFGLTDTDDVNVGVNAGMPIKEIYPDQDSFGTLLIPNSVALIKDSPNPQAGKLLIDYLLSPETEARLAHSESAQIPVREDLRKETGRLVDDVKFMEVDYEEMAAVSETAIRDIQQLLLR